MAVTKTLCIQGVSNISFDDAIRIALAETSKTVDHIFKLEVISITCNIKDNQIQEYIADTKISFKIDAERREH